MKAGKILLIGRNGQVGSRLEVVLRDIAEVVATDRLTLDLANPESIVRAVREAKPKVIVNAAAYTAVDGAESEPDTAMRINAAAPAILATEARNTGALLVHYSTDYIFDGRSVRPYVEADTARPLNAYGVSKLAGEQQIVASGCRHLILRTSWVYGPRGRNFVSAIAEKAVAGERLQVVDDQYSVPTESGFLAQQTMSLITMDANGIFHVVPTGYATRYGFAQAIVRALSSASALEPILSADYPARAERPRYSVMSSAKLAGMLGSALPSWESLLERALKRWRRFS